MDMISNRTIQFETHYYTISRTIANQQEYNSYTRAIMIDCLKCKNYYITWEPKTPHGCRAFGFKSKLLPSLVVLKSSGNPCGLFESKIPAK